MFPLHNKFQNSESGLYYLQSRYYDKKEKTISYEHDGEEIIDESEDTLEEMDIMQEKKFMKRFLTGLISENGLSTYGEKEVRTLRVYNWQDYIDEGLDENGEKVTTSVMEDWAEDYKKRTGEDVEFVYNTFETNEYMLNVLKTGSEHYD